MKIAVYGIGNNFIRNYKWISDEYEIVALLDSSKEKQNSFFQGMTIHEPKIISSIACDKILVTPNAHIEIVDFLLGENVIPEKIIFLKDILPSDDVGRRLRIAFRVVGGLGDALIALNYIHFFYKRFKEKHIELYLETIRSRNGFTSLIPKEHFFAGIIEVTDDEINSERYHLYIKIQRYPEILFADTVKIARLMPKLIDYVQLCEKFKIFNPRFFEKDFVADGESAAFEELLGRKRIMQPDIDGWLGICENYEYPLYTDENALQKFGVKSGEYISIHRGSEEKNYSENSTKLWPIEYYNVLLKMIRDKYPEIPIIFVGAEYEKKTEVAFQDINLIGKTTLTELAMLVGHAKLHIDTEGGVVHLRHAVSGKSSVVIFGPTSNNFFGYQENENIRSNICPYPCEWVSEHWNNQCIKGARIPLCMSKVMPEIVMKAAERFLLDYGK